MYIKYLLTGVQRSAGIWLKCVLLQWTKVVHWGFIGFFIIIIIIVIIIIIILIIKNNFNNQIIIIIIIIIIIMTLLTAFPRGGSSSVNI